MAGSRVRIAAAPSAARKPARVTALAAADERLRLHNLSPLKGARSKPTRKGRGYGAGQGGTCGFGNRGQKARAGRGTRPGFEGGQTPMYRRFPKLKGIAGGMGAGQAKYVTVNVNDIAAALASSKLDSKSEINLESLKSAGLIKASGYYRNLPLKVLGDGELGAGVTVSASAFSESAKSKIEAAGGTVDVIAKRPKWTRAAAKSAAEAAKA
jgi:large subunit ribosomal protein L15